MRRFSRLDKLGHAFYYNVMTWDDEIDAIGLLCPLPVLKARKRLKSMAPGAVLRVITTDPAALIDIPHFCAESGNELLDSKEDGDNTIFLVRKSA